MRDHNGQGLAYVYFEDTDALHERGFICLMLIQIGLTRKFLPIYRKEPLVPQGVEMLHSLEALAPFAALLVKLSRDAAVETKRIKWLTWVLIFLTFVLCVLALPSAYEFYEQKFLTFHALLTH